MTFCVWQLHYGTGLKYLLLFMAVLNLGGWSLLPVLPHHILAGPFHATKEDQWPRKEETPLKTTITYNKLHFFLASGQGQCSVLLRNHLSLLFHMAWPHTFMGALQYHEALSQFSLQGSSSQSCSFFLGASAQQACGLAWKHSKRLPFQQVQVLSLPQISKVNPTKSHYPQWAESHVLVLLYLTSELSVWLLLWWLERI